MFDLRVVKRGAAELIYVSQSEQLEVSVPYLECVEAQTASSKVFDLPEIVLDIRKLQNFDPLMAVGFCKVVEHGTEAQSQLLKRAIRCKVPYLVHISLQKESTATTKQIQNLFDVFKVRKIGKDQSQWQLRSNSVREQSGGFWPRWP